MKFSVQGEIAQSTEMQMCDKYHTLKITWFLSEFSSAEGGFCWYAYKIAG